MPRRRRSKRRGRRRGKRRVEKIPDERVFSPNTDEDRPIISIKVEEVEALRLVDKENLTQEEAAGEMGVCRKTFWNDLKSARKKVAEALSEGKTIKIEGGSYSLK